MSAAHAPLRPVRDRPTLVSYGQLACYGFFLYAFTPSLSLLRDEQGTTRAVSSLHGTGFAAAGVLAGLIAPFLVRRLGRGPMLRLGTAALIVGVLLYTSGLPIGVTVLGMVFGGLGGTLVLVGINAFLSEHQGAAAPAALNEGNAMAALFGLLGPVSLGVGVALSLGWRAGLWTMLVALVALEFWRGRDLEPYDAATGHPEAKAGHDPGGRLPTLYRWTWLVMFLLVGVEFCITLWGADLLRDRGGLGAAAAAAALVAVVGGMAIGRLGGAWVVERIDPERVLVAGIVVAAAGFALVWMVPAPVPMMVGLVVTGVGVGVHWPLGIARAVRAAAGRSDRASGLASVAAGLASGLAPFTLAAVADTLGVHTAFLVVPLLLVVALVLVLARPVPMPGRS